MANPNRCVTSSFRWACLRLALSGACVFATHVSRAEEPSSAAAAETSVDERTMAEARRQFQAGVNLLDDPDGARYEEAYHAFQKAYELSRSPKVLGNIGYCSLKLERDGEAIEAYTAYLRQSRDVDSRERAQIERDLATLGSTVASFTIGVAKPGPHVVVDTRIVTRGAPVVNSYRLEGRDATIRVRPGRHSFKVKGPEGESSAYETMIEPGTSASHAFVVVPPSAAAPARDAPRTSPSYAGPIVAGVLGLAAVGAGSVAGVIAKSKAEAMARACPNDVCPKTYDLAGQRTQAKTFATVADAAWIGGGVAIGTSVLWALLLPSASSKRTTAVGSPAPRLEGRVTNRGASVALEGEF